MGESTVKIPRLGIETAFIIATVLNINPVLAQSHQPQDRPLIQNQLENSKLTESKSKQIESQQFSNKAADLLPADNTSGFLTPINTAII